MNLLHAFAALLVVAASGAADAKEFFRSAKTPGGLTFWHLQRPESPRSTIIGSFGDDFALRHPDKIGAPAVGPSLLRSGPRGVSAGEFDEQLRDIQAGGGVSSSAMYATFTVEAKPEDIGEAIELYVKVLTEPALRDRDLERYKKNATTARAQMETSPSAIASWLSRRLVYGSSPFANWTEPEAIGRVTLADIDQWRREVFARDNVTIVAVGREDAATFGAHIDRAYGKLPEKAATGGAKPPALSFSGKTVVLERAMSQTAVAMLARLELDALTDVMAFNIGNNAFGGGMDRRLGRAIRQGQGATYGIGSSIGQPAPGQRTLGISSSLAHDLAAGAIAKTLEEYGRWKREGLTEAEMAASRSLLATSFDRSTESPGGKAFSLLSLLRAGRAVEDEAGYTETFRSISLDHVNRVVREKAPERFTTVIVAPSAQGFDADCVIRVLEEIESCR
jgi:zinc protease